MYTINGQPKTEQDLLDMARNYGYTPPYFSDFVIDILEDNGVDVEYIDDGEEDRPSMTNIAWIIIFLFLPFLSAAQVTPVSEVYQPYKTLSSCQYEAKYVEIQRTENFTWILFQNVSEESFYVEGVIGAKIAMVPTPPVVLDGCQWYCHPGNRPTADDPRQFSYLRLHPDGHGELWLPDPRVCGGLNIFFEKVQR